MSFSPYFVCALLGVDSLRGGLAEGNRFFSSIRHWVKMFSTKCVYTQNDQNTFGILGIVHNLPSSSTSLSFGYN